MEKNSQEEINNALKETVKILLRRARNVERRLTVLEGGNGAPAPSPSEARVYTHRWFNHKCVYINTPYGFAKLVVVFNEDRVAFDGEVYDLVVYPEHRGKGRGRELMNEIIGQAKKNRCERILLFPDCAEYVREWYGRLGFINKPSIRHSADQHCCAMVKTLVKEK